MKRRIGRTILLTVGAIALFTVIFGAITFIYYYSQPLPPPKVTIASEIYDDNGDMVTTLGGVKRFEVNLSDISIHFQRAIVAMEDHRFYSHHGVDLYGIARAVYTNIMNRTLYGPGGSTITQQMARNSYDFLGLQKRYSRKIVEAIVAIKLETIYTKDEILEMYCNVIYMGHSVYGVESASRLYFGKSAKDLNLNEAATLVGIVRSPGYNSPYVSMEKATSRRNIVLNRMQELGFITEEENKAAKAEEIKTVGLKTSVRNIDHFRNAVLKYLNNEITSMQSNLNGDELLKSGGLKIYTTMNTQMQEAAEEAVEYWGEEEKHDGLETALVAIDPQNGEIKAMVGSRDLNQSTWSRVFAKRPPGSTFKPFLYAAALESREYTAASVFTSEPVTFDIHNQEPYSPKETNKDEYYGDLTMRQAIARSSNITAISLNHIMSDSTYRGPWSTDMIDMAMRLGVNSHLDRVLSLPLGVSPVSPLEMANAYATFASGGYKSQPYFIRKIEDKHGNVLLENRPFRQKVLDENVAFIITDMLTSVLEPGGTASYLKSKIGRPAAAKTGTSEGNQDAWFVAYTPDIACAVWSGADDNSKTIASGGRTSGYSWSYFVSNGLKDVPKNDFTVPNTIVAAKIDPESGQLATRRCENSYTEYFLPGTEPTVECELHPDTIFPPIIDTDGDGQNDWDFWDWFFRKNQEEEEPEGGE